MLAPIGAMPMCHGASGLVAQHRFGARTGLAPALLGAVPTGALGALLLVAGGDLALSRRLVEARADCRPAIAAAALGTLLLDPGVGLAAGWLAEGARRLLRPPPRPVDEA